MSVLADSFLESNHCIYCLKIDQHHRPKNDFSMSYDLSKMRYHALPSIYILALMKLKID